MIVDERVTREWLNLTYSNGNMRHCKAYTDHGLRILYSEDNTPKWGWLKHISITRSNRYPLWDEILAIKKELLGDIDCMMVMPKQEDYINIHQYCFHVWQMPQEWGIR